MYSGRCSVTQGRRGKEGSDVHSRGRAPVTHERGRRAPVSHEKEIRYPSLTKKEDLAPVTKEEGHQ